MNQISSHYSTEIFRLFDFIKIGFILNISQFQRFSGGMGMMGGGQSGGMGSFGGGMNGGMNGGMGGFGGGRNF